MRQDMINKALNEYGRLPDDPTVRAWQMKIERQMAQARACL